LGKFSAGMSHSPGRLAVSMGKLLLSGGWLVISSTITARACTFREYRSRSLHGSGGHRPQHASMGLILTFITATKPPYYSLFGIYYASTFFSQILPSVGGDLVRVLYRRVINSTLGSAAISVLLDRGVAIAALLLVALPSVPFLAPFDPGHAVLRWIASVASCGLAAVYGGCLIVRAVRHSRVWMALPQWTRTLLVSGAWSITSHAGLPAEPIKPRRRVGLFSAPAIRR
jgi:hypothetical protein